MVKFLNLVPWGGLYFCYKPNEIIDLPEVTAIAREQAGLGKVIADKPKPQAPKPEIKPEAKIEPKPEAKPEPKPTPKVEPPKVA